MTKTTHEIGIELQGLIKLLARNLYARHDVFVRELLQNAHDALQRRHATEGDRAPKPEIRVFAGRNDKTLRVVDNGMGLNEAEVRQYLSVIGRSGTDAFRKELLEKGRQADATLIGQFGIGLLSTFIVADRVEVLTRRLGAPPEAALRWESEGGSTYTLEPATREEVGTTVTLFVGQDRWLDMLQRSTLEKAIRRYADFLPFPIYLDGDKQPANAITPPWLRHYASEIERRNQYTTFVAQRYPDNPLHVIPVQLTAPYAVDGILYISDWHIPDFNTTGLVDLYSSRMFVAEGLRDLLPRWAKFIRGVIDGPQLTLTAARDNVQQDEVFEQVQKALGQVIVEDLAALAKRDEKRLLQILEWHDYHVKMMAVAEDDFFEAIADLAPFETNDGPMTLAKYLERAPLVGGQRQIVYFTERGSATQHYILFGGKGLRVVNASGPFEEEFLKKYARTKGIELHPVSVATSKLIFPELEAEQGKQLADLEIRVARTLRIEGLSARATSFEPEYIPAVAVFARDDRLDREVETTIQNPLISEGVRELLKRVARDRRVTPVTLFLNAKNPSIKRLLAAEIDDETFQQAVTALYNNAILLAQHRVTPENAEIMFRQFSGVVDLLLRTASDLRKARQQLTTSALASEGARVVRAPWRTCFVAMPFAGYELFYEALRAVLEAPEPGFQVLRADEKITAATVPASVAEHIRRADCFAAEISDGNFNVGIELGLMRGYPERPVLFFRKKGVKQDLADLGAVVCLEYPGDERDPGRLAEALRGEVRKVEALGRMREAEPGRERYLSMVALREAGIAEHVVAKVVAAAEEQRMSAEAFLRGSAQDMGARMGVAHYLIEALKEHAARVYRLPVGGRG